jgi:hypothetical protein
MAIFFATFNRRGHVFGDEGLFAEKNIQRLLGISRTGPGAFAQSRKQFLRFGFLTTRNGTDSFRFCR